MEDRNVDRCNITKQKNLNLHQYLCEKRHIITDCQEDGRVLDLEVEGARLVRNLGKFLPVETA